MQDGVMAGRQVWRGTPTSWEREKEGGMEGGTFSVVRGMEKRKVKKGGRRATVGVKMVRREGGFDGEYRWKRGRVGRRVGGREGRCE